MKLAALDILKYSCLFLLFCLSCYSIQGQDKREMEFKIRRTELPAQAHMHLQPYLHDAKRLRYYKEIDGDKESFEVKFKKRRLHYSVEFDNSGVLEDVEFKIQSVDIPEESWTNMLGYFKDNFQKYTIKKIQQQYPLQHGDVAKTLEEAFQNLILPYINYELVFAAKKERGYQQYEILFNAKGQFLKLRKSFVAKYDHVLY